MEFTVTVSRQGNVVKVIEAFATSALAAIQEVEKKYKSQKAMIGDKVVTWSGYEFQARKEHNAMAAHAKIGVEQILESIAKGTISVSQLKAATELDCFTSDDLWLWGHIYDFVVGKFGVEYLEGLLTSDLFRLTEEWVEYGRPATREEWLKAKYPDLGGEDGEI